mmetsp:Transcript_8931/g.21978  ORF Transcript_8931/g.21978 Transcript_8931/m.21978 type:complete len:461 (-) Transcript_8931:323-1705(-)
MASRAAGELPMERTGAPFHLLREDDGGGDAKGRHEAPAPNTVNDDGGFSVNNSVLTRNNANNGPYPEGDCQRFFRVVVPLVAGFACIMAIVAVFTIFLARKHKHGGDDGGNLPVIIQEWEYVNFTSNCGEPFIVENNVITGIKAYNGTIYLTVPRWKPGVPSTLNSLYLGPDGAASLKPYPSCEWQRIGDANALQYVQSMEIDPSGRMWIIDVGRMNFATSTPINQVPPKIVIFDINANSVIRMYNFTNKVAPHNSSFLNDIVVDYQRKWAYISDTGAEGGIIAYDFNSNTARRFSDQSTQIDPSLGFVIAGVDYGTQNFTSPADGIALSPDGKTLYYCALHALKLYSVPTKTLQNMTKTKSEISSEIVLLVEKESPSDGLTTTSTGTIYYGGLTTASVYAISDPGKPSQRTTTIFHDEETMQWLDTFAFDEEEGTMLWTTNQLQRYQDIYAIHKKWSIL